MKGCLWLGQSPFLTHMTHTLHTLCVIMCCYRYATVYIMALVFSLVLDEDVSPDIALMYPELYRDLMKVDSAQLHM